MSGATRPGAPPPGGPPVSLPPPPGSVAQPPPAAAAAPAEDDQERKILTQQVSQAFYHLAAAQKEYMGDNAIESQALKMKEEEANVNQRRAAKRRGHSEEFFARGGAEDGGAGGGAPGSTLGGFKLEFTGGYITFIPELSLLFLTCLLPVLAISGPNVLTTLLVGVVATYIMDYMNYKSGTLTSVWLCIFAVWIGVYGSNISLLMMSWLNIFVVVNVTMFLLLLGAFATIQFKWLQLQHPEIALATERVLLGLSPLVCLPLIFSGFVSFVGSQLAPIGLVCLSCAIHNSFYTLKKSAFKEALTPNAKHEEYINGRIEAVVFTMLFITMPSYLHMVINHKEIFTALNLLTVVTLMSVPLLYLFYKPEKTLWFLYRNPYSEEKTAAEDIFNLQTFRKGVLATAYAAVLHWVIYRVAFGRFAHLFSGVRPPFNVILISMAAYCGSAVLYMAVDLVQQEQSRFDRAIKWTLILFLMLVAAVSFTYAAGMPQFVIACSAVSAACLTSFCLDPRNINNFLFFAISTFIMLTWWMYQSFSFLVMDLTILGGAEKISLPQLSVYILWLFLIQAMIFPLGLNHGTWAFYISLLQQVCALSMIEHILYSQPENLYPAVCVVGTTLFGIYFVRTLCDNKKISRAQASVLSGLYVAKAYLFFMCSTLPEVGSELHDFDYGAYTLVGTFGVVAIMAANCSQLYYERREKKRRASTTNLACVNVACACIVAVASRHSVVLALLELLAGEPPEVKLGRLLGLTILFAGLLQVPMTYLLPKNHSQAGRIMNGFLLTGAIVSLLDPALEGTGQDTEDFDIYEAPTWSGVVGVLSIAAVGATLLKAVRLPDNTAARIVWWGLTSIGSGCSFTAMFVPYATFHSYLLVSLVMVLVVLCIDFAHFSASAQKEDSNAIWGLYTGALLTLLAALLDVQWRVPEGFDRNLQFEVASMRQNAILALSIALNLVLAALIKLKLSDNPVMRPHNVSRVDAIRKNIGDGTHFGLLGNICVVQAYVSLLILWSDYGHSGGGFPVMASALLLLMHDDGWMFLRLGDSEQMARYVPPMVTSLVALTYKIVTAELPVLVTRAPYTFAAQLSVWMLAFAVACSATYDLWIDVRSRRSQGPADTIFIGLCAFLFLCAGTECIRLTVALAFIACVAPMFNDSAWARKLSSLL